MQKTVIQLEIPTKTMRKIEEDRIEHQVESTEKFIEAILLAREGLYQYPKFWRLCYQKKPLEKKEKEE